MGTEHLALALSIAVSIPTQDLTTFRAGLDSKLAAHPFFSKITFAVVDRHPPFVFYLQRPEKDVKHYERQIVNSYLPFLLRLSKIFDREYTTPLKRV